jgi:glycosyltransferase involved in cell wall biosynthesis
MPEIDSIVRDNLRWFDVVHLHCLRSYQNIIIHKYAKEYGVPYIIDDHGSMPRVFNGKPNLKSLLKLGYDLKWGYPSIDDASRLVFENRFAANEYMNFHGKNDSVSIIPLAYPIEKFANLPQVGTFREDYDIGDKKIILFMGRINKIKGLDFLVRSFKEYEKRNHNSVLVIAGNDDGYLFPLKKLIASLGIWDNVVFTGFLSGETKLSALVDADVVVQPSVYEQAAWMPVEALLCGTPVIVSKGTGCADDLKGMGFDSSVRYGEVQDMVYVMEHVIGDFIGTPERVKRARQYIVDNLSISKNVERYEDLYQMCKG